MKAKSKENKRGISRFAVNRGAVNVGLNVVSSMIINSSKRVRVDECHYLWGHDQDKLQLGDVQIALYLWHQCLVHLGACSRKLDQACCFPLLVLSPIR